jgi:CheY-like chemotaxis protein
VRAQSEGQGQGASFIVRLPVTNLIALKNSSSKSFVIDCQNIDLRGLKVLVIDDEWDARELLTRLIRACHAEVTVASNVTDALKLLSSLKPDVIVSDIGMPERDGYEFIRELRKLSAEEGGRTPAIALTAFARSEDRTRALMAGYQAHLVKPIVPQELLLTVSSASGRAGRAN